jgi:hypothetical protein
LFCCDVPFCSGIILFICLTGVPPYQLPALSDQRFALIYNGNLNTLLTAWQMQNIMSPAAKDIIARMLCPPERRANIQQILAHPFVSCRKTNGIGALAAGSFSVAHEAELIVLLFFVRCAGDWCAVPTAATATEAATATVVSDGPRVFSAAPCVFPTYCFFALSVSPSLIYCSSCRCLMILLSRL